jgi:DNA repair ATPase RecN
MKTMLLFAAVALACVAGAQAARAETDPVAAVKADVQKLVADATTLHTTVKADAEKITADIQALQGTKDRKAAAATLKADWQKLVADGSRLRPAVEADWAQLQTDLKSLRTAKQGSADLKALLQQANQALATQREAVKQAVTAANDAAKALRDSLKKK